MSTVKVDKILAVNQSKPAAIASSNALSNIRISARSATAISVNTYAAGIVDASYVAIAVFSE